MRKSAASEFNLPVAASLPFGEPQLVIYKITNKITGAAYIGLTKQGVRRRLSKHWRERLRLDTVLSRALIKYGRPAFLIEILAIGSDEDHLRPLEISLISQHKTHIRDGGYNMTFGGDGLRSPSEETLEKMRRITRERMACPEMRTRISLKVRGFKHTPEAKAAIAEASRNRIMSEETREKLRRPRGRLPQASIDKISRTKKERGQTVPAWGTEKARLINTGKPRSEETRRKISETKRARRNALNGM